MSSKVPFAWSRPVRTQPIGRRGPLSNQFADFGAEISGRFNPLRFHDRNALVLGLAYGLPRPRYQWRFKGQEIVGATEATFTLANASSADAGDYAVEVSNGLTNLLTPPA